MSSASFPRGSSRYAPLVGPTRLARTLAARRLALRFQPGPLAARTGGSWSSRLLPAASGLSSENAAASAIALSSGSAGGSKLGATVLFALLLNLFAISCSASVPSCTFFSSSSGLVHGYRSLPVVHRGRPKSPTFDNGNGVGECSDFGPNADLSGQYCGTRRLRHAQSRATSQLSRSSRVSRRISTRDFPSRTPTTAGRSTEL